MATYSIRDLEKLSGIKAHTIRIWEQRYHLIEPKRTQTNIRYYTEEDLKYVLNVAFLNKNGIRISKIAEMSQEEVGHKVASISQDQLENTQLLQSLTISMVELNEAKFHEIFERYCRDHDFESAFLYLIVPFLEKLSLLWLTGAVSAVHEQFIHNLIRQKIYLALEQVQPVHNSHLGTCLIYLNKGEEQDLSLLLMHYFLRLRGFKTLFLGQGLDLEDLSLAAAVHQPDYLLTAFSEGKRINPNNHCKQVFRSLPQTELWLLCPTLLQPKSPSPKLHCFELMEDWLDFVDSKIHKERDII